MAAGAARAACGCRCIRCKSANLKSQRIGPAGADGYYDMHHTCGACNAHFDHLEGVVFDACDVCGYDNAGAGGHAAASASAAAAGSGPAAAAAAAPASPSGGPQ